MVIRSVVVTSFFKVHFQLVNTSYFIFYNSTSSEINLRFFSILSSSEEQTVFEYQDH
jgi:hypothetical protein